MKTADDQTIADISGGASAPRSMRWLGSIAVVIALLSATVTFAVLAGLTPIAPTHQVVVTVLAVDALASLLLIAVIGREVWAIMQARRRGRAGAAAARAHHRSVLGDRRGTGDPDRGRRQHHARSRPRAVVHLAHPDGDPEFAHRLADLFQRAERDDPQRNLSDGVRRGARQDHVRRRPRALPPVPESPGAGARTAADLDRAQRSHRDREGRDRRCRRHRAAARERGACRGRRERAADRDVSGVQDRRGGDQAARLRRHLPLRRASARSARDRPVAGDAGERRANSPTSSSAASACRSLSR